MVKWIKALSSRTTKIILTGFYASREIASGVNMVIFEKQKWKKQKAGMELRHHITTIQKDFRKHLGTFIIGAFSFVAALLWRDAIAEVLKVFELKGSLIFYKFLSAIIVSIIAIFMIIVISRGFKVESQTSI